MFSLRNIPRCHVPSSKPIKAKKDILTVKLLSKMMYITTSPDLIIGSLQHVVFKIISGKPNRIFLGHAI